MLNEERWAGWIRSYTAKTPFENNYQSIPLVPFGTVGQLGPTTPNLLWGETQLFKSEYLGATGQACPLFVAPDEVALELAEHAAWGCCGPTAMDQAPETAHCANCGSPLGWEHRDCIGPVEFARLNPKRLGVTESDSPPSHFVSGPFQSELLSYILATEFPGADPAWRLMEIAWMIGQETVFNTHAGVHWCPSDNGQNIAVFDGPLEDREAGKEDGMSQDPILTIAFEVWYEHLRYAASLYNRLHLKLPNP